MMVIKRLLAPVYEAYRHHIDTKESGRLFEINSLLDLFNYVGNELSGKIKIRISHYSEATWNSLKTLVEAFVSDDRCDVLVILARNDERMREQVLRTGASYTYNGDYDVKSDRPDVLVISHVMDNLFKNVERVCVGKVFIVSSALIHYFDSIDTFLKITMDKYGAIAPDYYIFDRSMYDELKEADAYKDRLVCMGNPKYDGIYNAVSMKESIAEWRKLDGKKTVLWATDHGVQYGKIAEDFSFDKYARYIFSYFVEHRDIGLIFRPHSTFIEEMLKHGYWSDADISELKNRINRTDNIAWDEHDTYDAAYSVCDGIITDCHCGIICSALPTLKPIALLYRTEGIPSINDKLESCQYPIYSEDDLRTYLESVRTGSDEKRSLREHVSKEKVCNFDGMNGIRLHDFIMDQVMMSS